jgi:DNA-binding NarL/FixJ family response regulator
MTPSNADIRHASRQAAIAADDASTYELNIKVVWRELARGALCVADGFFTDERCYLLLTPNPEGAALTPIEGRRLEILAAVLSGLRQKNIAIDLALAPSTIALNSRLALQSLGVNTKPSRAHPLLMLAARAATDCAPVLARHASFLGRGGLELQVLSLPRPDRRLGRILPAAEREVIGSLVEGMTYDQIARQRGTSTRTIANQISTVFRRLRLSGRNELVQRLFSDEEFGGSAATGVHRTIVPPSVLAVEAAHSVPRRQIA